CPSATGFRVGSCAAADFIGGSATFSARHCGAIHSSHIGGDYLAAVGSTLRGARRISDDADAKLAHFHADADWIRVGMAAAETMAMGMASFAPTAGQRNYWADRVGRWCDPRAGAGVEMAVTSEWNCVS